MCVDGHRAGGGLDREPPDDGAREVVVVRGDRAIVGRPKERIRDLLSG
jgi:hypothetical protein